MLHIINKSPFEHTALHSCITHISDGGAILLIENGVIASTKNNRLILINALLKQGRVYALEPDLSARGLMDKVAKGVKLVDYKGFVELVATHHSSTSWF